MTDLFTIILKFFIFALLLLTISCSSNTIKKKEQKVEERSVEDIYNSAMDNIDDNRFLTAHNELIEVERLHPYSIWATRSQIMNAFVNYKLFKYDDSIAGAKRYIELHPGANDIDYAFYLIALNYYEQINDFRRDQTFTENAREAFNNLIRRFPNSDYAKDAKLKLDLVNDHLAAKEMDVGRTYQKLDNYVSAINRFKTVVDLYSKTSHVPEALARLTEMYYKLGLYQEAKVYASVLGYNYPENKWYLYSYSLFQKEKEILINNEENSYLNILDEFLDIFGN